MSNLLIDAFGRIVDVRAIPCRNGHTMTGGSIDIELPTRTGTAMFRMSFAAFDEPGAIMLATAIGDMVAVTGRCQLNRWRERNGAWRERLQCIIESARLADDPPTSDPPSPDPARAN